MISSKIFLVTTSVAALMAGAATASAQSPKAGEGGARGADGPAMQAPAGGAGGTPAGAVTPRGEAKGFDRGQPGERGLGDSKREARDSDGAKSDGGKRDGAGKKADKSDTKRGDKEATGVRAGDRDGDRNAQREDGETSRDGKQAGKAGKGDGAGKSAAIDVPEKAKTELKRKVVKSSLKRSKDIDIDVNVGVGVPRSVALYDLPPTWVTIVPAYRGYRYFYIDDVICIVDPNSYLIVDVIYI